MKTERRTGRSESNNLGGVRAFRKILNGTDARIYDRLQENTSGAFSLLRFETRRKKPGQKLDRKKPIQLGPVSKGESFMKKNSCLIQKVESIVLLMVTE